MKLVIIVGLALTACAAVYSPGLSSAAAVVAMVGWAYEHAIRMGDRDRLRQAGIELELLGLREHALLEHLSGAKRSSLH